MTISLRAAVLAAVCAFAIGVAQESASIMGTVTDPTGAVVPNVQVQLKGLQTGYKAHTTTNSAGIYMFLGVPLDEYEVKFDSPGFSAYVARVSVSTNRRTRVDCVLQIGGVTETVTVEARSPGVVMSSSSTVAGHSHRHDKVPAHGIRVRQYTFPSNTEQYDNYQESEFAEVRRSPLSTFSADVDTASYSNVRRFLNQGELPPPDSVRIEELINYFSYDYPQPAADLPFSVTTETTACPWKPGHRLLHIGLRTRSIDTSNLPPANLVFLLDVSGSMDEPNKLPLVQRSMRLLVNELRPKDSVAIAVYAGAAGTVLCPTRGSEKQRILAAIDSLRAGGSTNGADGIRLAYQMARDAFIQGGNNRVILATDGDFNVGVSSDDELVRLIESERDGGIFLTILGFGQGNYKDSKMEKLADHGNGNYSYIDNLAEAHKVLVEQMSGTLLTVAKDVKLQVEFNPVHVRAYRLVGYEDRILKPEEFNDDKKDAGDLGAGVSVTALYEVVPAGSKEDIPSTDELRYQQTRVSTTAASSNEIAMLKFRYKFPKETKSRLFTQAVIDVQKKFTEAAPETRFAAAVAEYGLLLRGSKFAAAATFEHVLSTAEQARGEDHSGYRAEFIRLVKIARALQPAAAVHDGGR